MSDGNNLNYLYLSNHYEAAVNCATSTPCVIVFFPLLRTLPAFTSFLYCLPFLTFILRKNAVITQSSNRNSDICWNTGAGRLMQLQSLFKEKSTQIRTSKADSTTQVNRGARSEAGETKKNRLFNMSHQPSQNPRVISSFGSFGVV